jgi:hypothetical protein
VRELDPEKLTFSPRKRRDPEPQAPLSISPTRPQTRCILCGQLAAAGSCRCLACQAKGMPVSLPPGPMPKPREHRERYGRQHPPPEAKADPKPEDNGPPPWE